MPLRDHFRPPISELNSWEEIHGMWPATIVQHLRRILPVGYAAAPKVRLGPYFEIDIGTFERDNRLQTSTTPTGVDTGGGTALWAPPSPTATSTTELADIDEYEVRIYSQTERRQLVAAIELVSPSNKDRFESRHAFISKCINFLRQGVCVTIVDVVTVRHTNLYAEMLELVGIRETGMSDPPPSLYAVTCRWIEGYKTGTLQRWAYPLTIGETLPTLPIWLSPTLPIPFDLEQSYEATSTDLGLI